MIFWSLLGGRVQYDQHSIDLTETAIAYIYFSKYLETPIF